MPKTVPQDLRESGRIHLIREAMEKVLGAVSFGECFRVLWSCGAADEDVSLRL